MTKENKNITPVPNTVFIAKSLIDGLGIFAKEYLYPGFIIGVSHVKMEKNYLISRIPYSPEPGLTLEFELDYTPPDNLLRTPMGSLLNHDKDCNTRMRDVGNFYVLEVLKDIQPNDEITVDYDACPCGDSKTLTNDKK